MGFNNFFSFKSLVIKLSLLITIFAIFTQVETFAQYKRNVVFEIFSEVWCGPCASLTPMHKVWLKNHPDYIPIYYYSYFTVNNLKVMNSESDYKYRQSYYAVPFYPYARINAVNAPNDAYPGYPTDTNRINAIIDTMSKTTPVKVEIDFDNKGYNGKVKIKITSDVELSNKQLFVFIVEKEHIYARQQNGLTDFNYIFRKTLPMSNGQAFSIKAGETLDFEYEYSIGSDINTDLYATALVQDNSTKYIYQAESVFKSFATSVNDYKSEIADISVYPNPAHEKFTIRLNSSEEIIREVIITDLLGNNILKISPEISVNHLTISELKKSNESFAKGLYIVRVVSDKNIYFSKIIIE